VTSHAVLEASRSNISVNEEILINKLKKRKYWDQRNFLQKDGLDCIVFLDKLTYEEWIDDIK